MRGDQRLNKGLIKSSIQANTKDVWVIVLGLFIISAVAPGSLQDPRGRLRALGGKAGSGSACEEYNENEGGILG